MCGICGKFVFSETVPAPSQEEMERMCQIISYRGPDSQGIKIDHRVGLGVRRLRVIDLVSGDQPLSNEDDSIWVVLNGEIYNYRELRSELIQSGHAFKTQSDTEVLVHLYEEYGDNFIERCNGMFAFCIYDVRRRRLYLARDRIGKKPLFYHWNRNFFLFGSELKSLFVNDSIPRGVDQSAILDFLTFGFVPTPHTAFEGVYQLEPAHYMVVESGEIRKCKYWDPLTASDRPRSLADAQLDYVDLLKTCVRDRLISDVPVGLLLSGGIDSCSIAAMMAEENLSVPTFTIRFENQEKDEGQIARAIARHIGAAHEELFVQGQDFINILPRLVWHYEQPFGDSSAIPSFYVAQLARQHVTVALNGDEGDECFGGYWRHLFNLWLYRLRWVPRVAWRLIERVGSHSARSLGERRMLRWLVWTSRAAQRSGFEASLYWLSKLANGPTSPRATIMPR